jgi:hypothetical protein
MLAWPALETSEGGKANFAGGPKKQGGSKAEKLTSQAVPKSRAGQTRLRNATLMSNQPGQVQQETT